MHKPGPRLVKYIATVQKWRWGVIAFWVGWTSSDPTFQNERFPMVLLLTLFFFLFLFSPQIGILSCFRWAEGKRPFPLSFSPSAPLAPSVPSTPLTPSAPSTPSTPSAPPSSSFSHRSPFNVFSHFFFFSFCRFHLH